jgi:uncharacterized protein with gpF-like domain
MGFDLKIGAVEAESIANSTFKINTIKKEVENENSDEKNIEFKDKDNVTISAEGLQKSNEAAGKSSKEVAQEASEDYQVEEMIKEKIKKVEKELKELRKNPEQNEKAIKMKEQELEQYQGMLMQILNEKKGAGGGGSGGAGGGTPAQTVDSSLTETPKGMLCEIRF